MPWNVEGQGGKLSGEKGNSRSNCAGTTGHPLPGTACPFGLGKSQGLRKTEGQALSFLQLVPEQLSTKRSISAGPGSQFRGLRDPWARSILSHQAQAQGEDSGC